MSGQSRKLSMITQSKKLASEENEAELPISPQIRSIIRKKVSSYLNCQIDLPTSVSRQINIIKKAKPLPKQYTQYKNLQQFLFDERNVFHLYKQKIDRNMDQSQYIFLKILSLAIDFQCRISEKEIDKESSVTIDAFIYIAWSLLEAGADKAAFYFASMGAVFCQYYKTLNPIGQFMLIMAKISRKHFRYRESIIILKKALEYNWWKDDTNSSQLNKRFISWLGIHYPQDVQAYKQEYQIARVFVTDPSSYLKLYKKISINKQMKELEKQTFKDLFTQFTEAQKIRQEVVKYKVVPKKAAEGQSRHVHDLEAQIYNQMSFNFLQLNQKQESKIFAEKYESGYIEPEDSKIIALSGELIFSIQKRTPGWHKLDRKTFQLLFFVDIFQIVSKNRHKMRTLNQQNILQYFKADFQTYFDNLLKKQIFSYQIPLPLQLKKQTPKLKKKMESKKFIIKQRSNSQMNKPHIPILQKYSSDKVEQNLLFNFRGVGVSRLKLLDIYKRFIEAVRQKYKQGSFQLVHWNAHLP